MYFPNQELNDVDRLLQSNSPAEQKLMIAQQSESEPAIFRYQIVIEKA
jgi:hypothetical protein